jgi:hypothetical protein
LPATNGNGALPRELRGGCAERVARMRKGAAKPGASGRNNACRRSTRSSARHRRSLLAAADNAQQAKATNQGAGEAATHLAPNPATAAKSDGVIGAAIMRTRTEDGASDLRGRRRAAGWREARQAQRRR